MMRTFVCLLTRHDNLHKLRDIETFMSFLPVLNRDHAVLRDVLFTNVHPSDTHITHCRIQLHR